MQRLKSPGTLQADQKVAELTSINLSLSSLGLCISALCDHKRRHVRSCMLLAQLQRAKKIMGRGEASRFGWSVLGCIDVGCSDARLRLRLNPFFQSQSREVPFRNSKLTRLLRDSLVSREQGHCVLFVCISPSALCADETLCPLLCPLLSSKLAGTICTLNIGNFSKLFLAPPNP